MITQVGHGGILRRIGINVGAGYVPGINVVITGAAQAGGRLGWEIVGIRQRRGHADPALLALERLSTNGAGQVV